MSADMTPAQRRVRLLVMVAPGVLVVAGAAVTFLVKRSDPEFDFGKRPLLLFSLVGLALSLGGFVLHRKALADFRTLRRAYWKTLLFSLVCVLAGPLATVLLLEQSAALYLRLSAPAPIFVLRPNTSESYQTPEFTFTATTNSLGIRGRDVDLRRKPGLRVLALGDSFTYGWGVNDAEAWPALVERTLAEKGHPAEILNCGCPGAGVDAYAEVAERLIPVAKPDVVLVAVLQGIDLKLADLGTTTNRLYEFKLEERRRSIPRPLARALPNLCELPVRLPARVPEVRTAEENRKSWQDAAQWMTRKLTPHEAQYLDNHVDPSVREMFDRGDINPWEVYFALKYPDYVSFTLHPDQPEVQKAVDTMARQLRRIREAAAASGAKVAVLSVPPAWYFSEKALRAKRLVGYRLDDNAVGSAAPDEMIRSASESAGLEFHSFNERFLTIGEGEKWYFPYDGMYDTNGHAIFAAEVAKTVLRILE
jgi:hypothetical protein